MEDEANEELTEKVSKALRALQELRDLLEEQGADDGLIDSCALAQEGMESLACDLGYGVMNGMLVDG